MTTALVVEIKTTVARPLGGSDKVLVLLLLPAKYSSMDGPATSSIGKVSWFRIETLSIVGPKEKTVAGIPMFKVANTQAFLSSRLNIPNVCKLRIKPLMRSTNCVVANCVLDVPMGSVCAFGLPLNSKPLSVVYENTLLDEFKSCNDKLPDPVILSELFPSMLILLPPLHAMFPFQVWSPTVKF